MLSVVSHAYINIDTINKCALMSSSCITVSTPVNTGQSLSITQSGYSITMSGFTSPKRYSLHRSRSLILTRRALRAVLQLIPSSRRAEEDPSFELAIIIELIRCCTHASGSAPKATLVIGSDLKVVAASAACNRALTVVCPPLLPRSMRRAAWACSMAMEWMTLLSPQLPAGAAPPVSLNSSHVTCHEL